MNSLSWTTNRQPTFRTIDPNKLSFSKKVDFSHTGYGTIYRKSSDGSHLQAITTSITQPFLIPLHNNVDIKDLIDGLNEYAAKFMAHQELERSPLVVDTREREPFDWVKTTNAYQRIVHLSDLEDGWDGYDAPSFSKEQIERGLNLYVEIRTYSLHRGISWAKIEPFIAPGSDGTILFEWAGKRFPVRQLEVYVPVSANENFEYLKTMSNSNSLENGESESEGDFTLKGLYPILDWLFHFYA